MSFDLYFVSRREDEDWGAVMHELEAAAADSGRSLSPHDLDVWAAVRSCVESVSSGWEESAGDRFRELSSESDGIQISMSPGEVTLTVPYWHAGDAATAVVGQLRRISVAVEETTGLVAYDPQSGGAFLESDELVTASSFEQTTKTVQAEVSDSPRPAARKRRWPFKDR